MSTFDEVFGASPDASAAAHGRVNLLGEHTDYNEGYVLPTAIPQQTRVALRRRSKGPTIVYSANLDAIAEFEPDAPPAESFARYVYGCLEESRAARLAAVSVEPLPPLDIHIASDVPMGVGLSSSAALEVATLRALRTLLRLPLDDVRLAEVAQRAEVRHAGVNCGILDQMSSSLLAPGAMLFLDTRTFERQLLPLPRGAEILVIDSGVSRALAESGYNERRAECERAAAELGVAALRDTQDLAAAAALADPQRRRAQHVITENQRVLDALRVAGASEFGALMNASHASLRDHYEVSTPELDTLVTLVQRDPDAYGAKLTGAGFGGACVALCRAGTARAVGERVLRDYAAEGHTGRMLVPW